MWIVLWKARVIFMSNTETGYYHIDDIIVSKEVWEKYMESQPNTQVEPEIESNNENEIIIKCL